MASDGGELLGRLRGSALRLTSPRRSVVKAIDELGSHFTADQLTDHVQRSAPEVHKATIYRTLDTLTRLGMVEHVHLGHGPSVFHLVGEGHQHLVCQTCGRVVEVPDDLFVDVGRKVAEDYGFELQPGHFALAGRCGDCRSTN